MRIVYDNLKWMPTQIPKTSKSGKNSKIYSKMQVLKIILEYTARIGV